MSVTPGDSPPQTPNEGRERGGVPLWLPLLAILIALIFAGIIAGRVIPTLSAIVSPPDPVLPANSVLKSKESKGTEDQWLYESTLNACTVAKVYEQAYKSFEGGGCVYSPVSGCFGPTAGASGSGVSVARCGGKQSLSNFNIQWSVVISTGNTSGNANFRIYREVN